MLRNKLGQCSGNQASAAALDFPFLSDIALQTFEAVVNRLLPDLVGGWMESIVISGY